MRAVWPAERPMSVRISAHDWVPGGNTPDDAVEIARAFKAAGADLIDVSSGQVSKQQQPVYGRMYQTPFADRIRNEVGIATMAVGAITEADHVNSIIAAGRADLCAIARPHLANPAWTLLEAAKIGHTSGIGADWPVQYLSGKNQLERNLERERQMAAQTAGLSPQEQANLAQGVVTRWPTVLRRRRPTVGIARRSTTRPPGAQALAAPAGLHHARRERDPQPAAQRVRHHAAALRPAGAARPRARRA